ncbi:MAG TPA: hypothetical protein VH063_11080 [Gaiellaceae bacterium]|jgi:hypothetical protein|nr:hypothetical protein [Gaiellaceae bacterium]
MTAQPEAQPANAGSGRDALSIVLIVIALVGSVLELFFRPFLFALPALVITMVGVTVSNKYYRLGTIAAIAITVCFVIGASIAVWYSRPLY